MTKKAKNRETKFDDYIGIPVEKELKKMIAEVAERDDRNPTDMARMLLKEAVANRREKVAAG
jgi:hypothetical protein